MCVCMCRGRGQNNFAILIDSFIYFVYFQKVTAGIGAVHALAKIAYATGYYTGGMFNVFIIPFYHDISDIL